jgi:PPM family protein phosphatase
LLETGGVSVSGPVRENNQDAILCLNCPVPSLGGSLHAVADGMGGYAGGEVASSLALKSLSTRMTGISTASPQVTLRKGIEAANFDVYRMAQTEGFSRMGTTLTAAYILGEMLYLVHIGDSRAYLVRNGQANCLTSDHSVVADMVRAKLISPDKIRTHAQRSILTRAVGLELFIRPEIIRFKLLPEDRIILCSDGVWSVVQDDEFASQVSPLVDSQTLSQRLVDLALERRTDDNCSVVSVQIHGFQSTPDADPPVSLDRWSRWIDRKGFLLKNIRKEKLNG